MSIARIFARWRERHALQNELAALEANGELDAALADAGLNRSQVPTLLGGGPQGAELMARMTRRLGVDPARLPAGVDRREVAWNCVVCGEKTRCEHWLDSGAKDEAWRSFCPNADTFTAARSDK
jgi:uncharacterized protein YjiS (DUF1127 family)